MYFYNDVNIYCNSSAIVRTPNNWVTEKGILGLYIKFLTDLLPETPLASDSESLSKYLLRLLGKPFADTIMATTIELNLRPACTYTVIYWAYKYIVHLYIGLNDQNDQNTNIVCFSRNLEINVVHLQSILLKRTYHLQGILPNNIL